MAVSTPVPALNPERTPVSTPGGTKAKEEKIVVTVRLRPLNKRELSSRDQVAWECLDKQTIVFRPPPQDRSLPASFTFDRIFGPDSLTECIYDESIKTVALSALKGINSTIFAYGQTSSGKTYTMRGITEKVVRDLYKHIMDTPERDFTIKFSGLEIYNENVKDLLNSESGRNLKLLDDPEKGTVVEKLVEEMATGEQHLKHMISICESQRQVGETSLNDTSSRSHQIIRLIIESTQRQNSDCIKSYLASLNLVDLAGSERAAQTNTDGVRLREGCHINLSLMTLTTVIRKLSVGKRCGHVPYRDSKLTRILQHSLGGNARTAIICTLSPALAHVEQSRNTLSFATRAKEVTNTAQVNMVVSEKQLVKQLKKEVARLEAELRTPDTSKEKNDVIIQQMLIEIEDKELKNQQMRLEIEEKDSTIQKMKIEIEQLRHKADNSLLSVDVSEKKVTAKCLSFSAVVGSSRKRGKGEEGMVDGNRAIRRSRNGMRQSSTVPLILVNEIRKLERQQQQLGDEANRAVEVLQKQVACHQEGNQDAAETIAKLQAEINEMRSVRPPPHSDPEHNHDDRNTTAEACASLKEEITRLHTQGSTIDNLEGKLESMQRCIDNLTKSIPLENNNTKKKNKRRSPLSSTNPPNKKRSPGSQSSSSPPPLLDSDSENREPDQNRTEEKKTSGSNEGDHYGPCYQRSGSVGMKKMKMMFENAAEENVRGIRTYVTELKERVAKLQYQKHLLVCQVLEMEGESIPEDDEEEERGEEEEGGGRVPWETAFEEQRREIVQLWHDCYASIIHRSQFYLLFRGDETDQIYMEVELRRLTWLRHHFSGETGGAAAAAASISASKKALKREREALAKRMGTHMSAEEREGAYRRWGVAVDGKHRRMQVMDKLWRETGDGPHVEESAEMVARLVGFEGAGEMPKEMFELNFASPADRRPWLMGWNHLSNLLHL